MELIVIGIIIAIALLIQIPAELKSRRLMRRYWSRPCTGFKWKRRFPEASKESIREFLDLFLDAFMLGTDKRLKFAPDDKINDVYRIIYPPNAPFRADALEHSFLISGLEEKYGIDFTTNIENPNVTLGQLFEMARNHNNNNSLNTGN